MDKPFRGAFILLGLLLASPALAADELARADLSSTLDRIERLLSGSQPQVQTESPRWIDLEKLHEQLWRTMAMDPIHPGPDEETPAEEMTRKLEARLAALMATPMAKELLAKPELADYVSKCQQMIELRNQRLYRDARRVAKTSNIDHLYSAALEQYRKSASQPVKVRLSVAFPADLESQLRAELAHLRGGKHVAEALPEAVPAPIASPVPARMTRAAFSFRLANLLWLFVAFPAFFAGRASGRRNGAKTPPPAPVAVVAPEPAPPAAPKKAPPPNLDYATWMRRYEETLLARKSYEERDKEFVAKLNGFSWAFSQFFVQYHMDEPLLDVKRFRQDLEAQSERVKDLVAEARECVSRGDQSYREILDQLLVLCDSIEIGTEKAA